MVTKAVAMVTKPASIVTKTVVMIHYKALLVALLVLLAVRESWFQTLKTRETKNSLFPLFSMSDTSSLSPRKMPNQNLTSTSTTTAGRVASYYTCVMTRRSACVFIPSFNLFILW
eukprot:sb/3476801/